MRKRGLLLYLLLLVAFRAAGQHWPVGVVSVQDTTKTLQAGLFSSVAVDGGHGLQLAAFSNMSARPFRGLQLSGVSNIARGLPKGVQLSALLNVSSGYMRGVQLAAVNYADSLNGPQVGLVNVARTHPQGWQVGLVNITHDTIAHKIGLININPHTHIDYMVSGGTATKTNLGIRFRNRSTYSIVGVGTHFMGLDEKFSGALYYRLGQYFPITRKLTVSGDLGFYHIETFEQHSNNTPERLFSIQARLNADYQLSRHMGVFASVGWGDTRYYHRAKSYRSRPLAEVGITLRHLKSDMARPTATDNGQPEKEDDKTEGTKDRKRPWLAAAEVVGINAGVHLFDRWALNEEFAQTTFHSIGQNFKTGFVWDNDVFITNMFAHPYHGNLYFNTARTNGMTFWESAPFALGGSLMWEFFGETEPPAINDVLATACGGIALGEMTHRLSQLVLNDRSRGFRRFLREAAGTIINPIQGLHRLATGQAWKTLGDAPPYHDYAKVPIDFSLTAGVRYLADDGAMFRGEYNPFVNMYLCYGTAVDGERHRTPYDFFDMDVTFGLSGNQPLVNALHIMGRLWSTPILDKNGMEGEFGIYQHFNYYDSKPVKDGSDLTPYRISEAAAFGPGFIVSFPQTGALSRLEQRVFVSAILLGGTKSDYFNVIERDYNMGSGLSIKSKTHLEFGRFGRLIMHAKYFRLFTWKGYEDKDLAGYADGTKDLHYLNVQGDRGNAQLLVINPIVEVNLYRQWSLNLAGSYFYRHTRYKYHDNVRAKTFEVKVGLTCHF
ncbi:MAG: DUF3943 domain-containing protein [Prevotella sp.]|nr:DUF3943 domain-containing protein [Prevotella sp.]